MVEKTRKIPHNKGVFAAVLADLSKAFDSISNAFPIAKLNAYDFDKISWKFIFVYLNSRKKRANVGFTFSNLFNIIFGVQKGSILRPLLIIIFICDLFLLDKDLNSANCRPQGGFIAPNVWEIVVRKNLTIFKGCHYSRFYIMISLSFRKIETKNLNSDPHILIFLVLGTTSSAAH